MTIELTEEQVAYIREYLYERLQENLDLEEAEMLHDLAEKLDDETQNTEDE